MPYETRTRNIANLAKSRGLFVQQIRLLQPVHFVVLVGDADIFVIMSPGDTGAMVINNFKDWTNKPINLQSAIFLAERDLAFRNTFGLQFPHSILDLENEEREKVLARVAQQYIDDEIHNLEKLKNIVRINPIFKGRDFSVDHSLVFVLSPFGEPFDTIFSDHVKPAIEGIEGLICLRADDIYDNQPIIEDIWRYTNEAKVLISELTGRNANVFYETGIAHTVGKEVILITQSMDDVPFDLRHLRCIVYDYTPRGISNLEQNLRSTISHILASRG